jgi:hypothetical protein
MADPAPKKLTFDPTINAGHILTFIAMVVGLMTSYSLLDKRIGVLEERSNAAIQQATERTTEQKDAIREIKSDIKDVQRSLNEISRAVLTNRRANQ